MPARNQPRSSRGRSAIARKAMNTNSTNGMMYQGTCIAHDGTKITPCRNFGGMKKGGAHPSATGFMRSQPYKMSVPAKNKNYLFNMQYFRKSATVKKIIPAEIIPAEIIPAEIIPAEIIPPSDCSFGQCTGVSDLSGCIMPGTDGSLCCTDDPQSTDGRGCTDSTKICALGDTKALLCGRDISSCSLSPTPSNKLTPEVAAKNIASYLNDIKAAGYIANYGEDGQAAEAPTGIDCHKRELSDPLKCGRGDDFGWESYGLSPENSFEDAVYVWNTFIYENNKKTCTTIAYNHWDITRIPVQCERATFPDNRQAFAGELDSLFDSLDVDLNKIELALILSNAWNESGGNVGLFNHCLQRDTPNYSFNKCPNNAKYPYNNILVGRGLLQLSNPGNYINVAHILNKMGNLKINDKYENIINKLPTGILYPQVCGDPSINECPYTQGSVDVSCCVDIPTSDGIGELCSDISSADNIFTNPSIICTQPNTPLAVLSSLIYSAANSSSLVKKNNYSFLLSACSVNMGGVVYPVPDTEDNVWLRKVGAIPDDKFIKEYIYGGGLEPKWCTKAEGDKVTCEGCDARWKGFCIIMDILFPGNKILENNTKNFPWKIKLDKYTYEGTPSSPRKWLGTAKLVPIS
jgi:hypothetical protein